MHHHILHIARWYPNETDKQQASFVYKHIRAISSQNKCTLLTVQRHTSLGQKYRMDKSVSTNLCEYIVYFQKTKFRFVNAILYFYYHLQTLRVILREQGKPALIHVHVMYGLSFTVWVISKKLGIPYIMTEHWNGFTNDSFKNKNALFRLVTRAVGTRAELITAVSSFLKEGLLQNKIHNRITIVPNIVEGFEGLPRQLLQSGVVNILTVADLDDRVKNISGILKVLFRIKKESNTQFKYNVIGHGKDEILLKKLTKDYGLEEVVIFWGLKENKEVLEYLACCDFVIINSRIETYSVVLAETYMSGKPAIVTACGGPQEIFDPQCGMLIAPDNERELYDAVKDMLHSYKSFDSQEIKRMANTKFPTTKAARLFQDIYNGVILGNK